jgi:hypothetical protein
MTRSPTPTPTLVVAAIPPPAEREEEEDGGGRVGWYLLGFDATYHVRDEGRYTRRPATVARMRTTDGGGGGAEEEEAAPPEGRPPLFSHTTTRPMPILGGRTATSSPSRSFSPAVLPRPPRSASSSPSAWLACDVDVYDDDGGSLRRMKRVRSSPGRTARGGGSR